MSKPAKGDGATQDWSEVLKGATPEAVAEALLKPRKPIKPPPASEMPFTPLLLGLQVDLPPSFT